MSVWANCMDFAKLPISQNIRLDFWNPSDLGRDRKSMYLIVVATVHWNAWKEENRRIFLDLATSYDPCTLETRSES